MARGEKTELTDEQVEIAVAYAGLVSDSKIASMIGVSRDTFTHLTSTPNNKLCKEFATAKNNRITPIASDVYKSALKGDQKAQFFVLSRMGGWTEKQETDLNISTDPERDLTPTSIGALMRKVRIEPEQVD